MSEKTWLFMGSGACQTFFSAGGIVVDLSYPSDTPLFYSGGLPSYSINHQCNNRGFIDWGHTAAIDPAKPALSCTVDDTAFVDFFYALIPIDYQWNGVHSFLAGPSLFCRLFFQIYWPTLE